MNSLRKIKYLRNIIESYWNLFWNRNNNLQNDTIFFFHFHKGGGTTINHLFRKIKKYPNNRNGNPWGKNNIIPFWNYDKKEFNNFKLELKSKKVKFVAFEWNFFKNFNCLDFDNIELITVIRDPYERFISNMNVDGHTDPLEYSRLNSKWERKGVSQTFNVNYNKFNYYVKMLNGYGDNHNIEVNEEHLKIAKKNLGLFSIIIILENQESFDLLKKYGINNVKKKRNINKKKKIYGNLSLEDFKKKNAMDYKLYEYTKSLSKEQLKQYKF